MGVTSFRYGGGGASRGERCGVGGVPARACMSASACDWEYRGVPGSGRQLLRDGSYCGVAGSG